MVLMWYHFLKGGEWKNMVCTLTWSNMHITSFIWLISMMYGTKAWDCKNIMGICSLHFITWIFHKDIALLKLKDLTSFYNECMDDNPFFCENKTHVQLWRLHTMEQINIIQINFQFQTYLWMCICIWNSFPSLAPCYIGLKCFHMLIMPINALVIWVLILVVF
jgi:hypothetical protein